MSLGTLLVKHGWITKQQLGLAISRQREIGGRLGTCLLEMGAVTEELLNRSLAEQQGVPTATAEDLTAIEEKVSRLLPAPIAIRYRAVPFRATHSDVDIAMLEVDNLWLQDELSFIVGRRLSVYIATEARVVETLSRYYKAPCSERFVKLLTVLNRERRHVQDGTHHPQSRLVQPPPEAELAVPDIATNSPSPPLLDDSTPASVSESIRPQPLNPVRHSIPLSAAELATLDTKPAGEPISESDVLPSDFFNDDEGEPHMSVEEAEVALETTLDPQEIGRVLISVLSQEFTRVCLLQASPTQIRGWLAHGPGLDEARLRQYSVSAEQPSIFLNLREGGSFFLGALPAMSAHVDLAACWHKDLSDECAVFPIRVQDRLVTLVYGDRGPLGLADLDLDLIRGFCVSAARAFERCIMERKRRGRAVVSGESSTL